MALPFTHSSLFSVNNPNHHFSPTKMSSDDEPWWQNPAIPSDSDGEGNPIEWWEEGHGNGGGSGTDNDGEGSEAD